MTSRHEYRSSLWKWLHSWFLRRQVFSGRERLFVLGNQKSGTTAIAGLLGDITQLPTTLDIKREYRAPTLHLVTSGAMKLEQMIIKNISEFARPIVKVPNLTFHHEDLKRLFPNARFLLVVRDPRDNIRSILNRLKLPGTLKTLTQEHWDQMPIAWRYVLNNEWQGIQAANHIESLAKRWNVAASVFLKPDAPMMVVRYEDFLQDKVGTITHLAKSLGLDIRSDIADRVHVQFQPAGVRNVRWDDFFGEENLGTINTICGPLMSKFNYRTDAVAPDQQ